MHTCGVCGEAITNPMCCGCLKEEVKAWAMERAPKLVRELDDFDSIFSAMAVDGSWCIRCRSPLQVCAHCFITEIKAWLDDRHPLLGEELVERFNYEIRSPYNELRIMRDGKV